MALLCRSRANPPVSNYTWYKDEQQEVGEAGQSLLLASVEPSHAGQYRCSAGNQLGETVSPPTQLDVQCESVFFFLVHSGDIHATTMTHKHVFYVALLYIQLRSLTRTWTQAKSGSGCSAVWSSDSRGIVTSRHHLGAASSASPAPPVQLCLDVLCGARATSHAVRRPAFC